MAINPQTSAPTKNPLAKVFRPYFNARWQNMQNIVSDVNFYSQMPPDWVAYQNAYVRQWDEWSRGFVLTLHRKDMFSVGMGYTVCEILTRECLKGRYRFDGEDTALNQFITDWAEKTRLADEIEGGFLNANRLGNNILRLNVVAGEGEVYATSHGVNTAYIEIDRSGKVIRAIFNDYLSADTINGNKYICVEDRILFDDIPYYRVKVVRNGGTVTTPVWSDVNDVEKLDTFTQSRFRSLYGDIEPNTWYQLPFKTLGVYNWKNKAKAVAINSMPGYSDSSIHLALDILYSIDYNWSMGQLDMYWGRTRVMIGQEFRPAIEQRPPMVHNGITYQEAMTIADAPLSDDIYSEIPNQRNISDKPQQPVFIQPDLRGEAHRFIRDSDLELLASKCGLSASTLANHLTNNNAKTAMEVDVETDTTETTVGRKRELAEQAINAMLADVVKFYGFTGKVDITWNQTGNNKRIRQNILEEYAQRLIPLEEAIQRLHPELTKEEVNKWAEQLRSEKQTAETFDENILLG